MDNSENTKDSYGLITRLSFGSVSTYGSKKIKIHLVQRIIQVNELTHIVEPMFRSMFSCITELSILPCNLPCKDFALTLAFQFD